MFHQNRSQPYRFVTKLPADSHLTVGRKVALGEQDIEDLVHAGQSRRTLLSGKLPETTWQFPQTAAGSTEAFVYIGFAGKQPKRNLPNIETTERLQSEDQLRFHGDCLVAGDKE